MPIALTLPVGVERVRELRVGDEVLLSGPIVTGRDAAHRYLATHDDPAVRAAAEGTFIYHCGPVVSQDPATGAYRFLAAGPTTSLREEPWQADVVARQGLRGVIGRGGMGPRTLAALQAHGAVYLHAVGALAVVLARCVTRVRGAFQLDEFGVPEAIWHVDVKDFPAIVTMDAHGNSLHEAIRGESAHIARELMERKVG